MKKKIAFFDIDGVIYNGHSMLDQIGIQEKSGILQKGTRWRLIFEAAQYKLKLKDYKHTAESMLKIHCSSLRNQMYKKVEEETYFYLKKHRNSFFQYFIKLVPILKKTYDICLVTNNFQFLSKAVGKLYGIKMNMSSIAGVKNGRFTGKVSRSLVGNKAVVSDLIEKYGKKGSLAVGNSFNDSDMLNLVEYPFLFEPDNLTKTIAEKKKWQIISRNNAFKVIVRTLA